MGLTKAPSCLAMAVAVAMTLAMTQESHCRGHGHSHCQSSMSPAVTAVGRLCVETVFPWLRLSQAFHRVWPWQSCWTSCRHLPDLLDVQHMGQAAAAKANMVRVDEISLFKQQQVHACGLSC